MTDVNALNGYTQTGTTNNTASQNLVGGHEHLSDPVNHAVEISGSA